MLQDLETPVLVLDRARVERNCARMRERLAAAGVALRPHVKTAKSIEVVNIACGGKPAPITASTLKEAEWFFERGFTDILYAVGIVPGKLARAAALMRRGCTLSVILDGVQAARALADFTAREGVALPALIEIDSDGNRAGVKPEAPELLEIGAILGPGLRGVMTHAGNSYTSRSEADLRMWAKREREGVVRAAQRLRAAGHACPVVSVGSTPTALFGESFEGVNEVRAGVYMFFDLVMVGIGVARVDELALSVLATVIGHQPEKGWILTDAGWTAMSRDRGTAKHPVDQGFGLVADLEGRPIGDLIVVETNQEHGIIARRGGGPADLGDFPVGRQLRIFPNHACATGAQHTSYNVVNGGTSVEARWERFNGW
ncbi:alanine racemase [Betaproteobacteria bacterium GR16-43]|nr:alanine racemase [Betaproteobacteria bacterium GR16-43]